jgi:hypothetical protein
VRFQSPHDGTAMLLTPEASMDMQNALGADVMMALDDVVGFAACAAFPSSPQVPALTTGPRVEVTFMASLFRC